MSNPLKKIGKAIKSVAKSVKKVFSSNLGKAVLIGAGLFFGIPAAATALGVGAGAAGGAAAGAGAKAWWTSTLGMGAGSAGTAVATNAAAGSVAPAVAGQAATTLPSLAGASGATAGTGAGMVSTGAALDAAAVAGGAGATTTAKTGLLGKAAAGFNKMSPFAQGALVNVAGQGIAGMAKSRAEQKALEEEREREDAQRNERSIFGVRFDADRPTYEYNVGQMMNQAIGGYQPAFANWGMAPQKPKEKSEGLLGYNPYIYGSA